MKTAWLLVAICISSTYVEALELIFYTQNQNQYPALICSSILSGSAACMLATFAYRSLSKKITRWHAMRRLCSRFRSKQTLFDTYDEIILKKTALKASFYKEKQAQLDAIERSLNYYKPCAHHNTLNEFKEIAHIYANILAHSDKTTTLLEHFLPLVVHEDTLEPDRVENILRQDICILDLPDCDKEDLIHDLIVNAQQVIAQWGAQKYILKSAVAHSTINNYFDLKIAENYLAYCCGNSKGNHQFPIDSHAICQQQSLLGYLKPRPLATTSKALEEQIRHLQTNFLSEHDVEFLAS